MSKHLFGLIVTPHGTAANNRGETMAPATTTLQKIIWNGDAHTTVSAEAIRWAIRWYWQRQHGNGVMNRQWNDETSRHGWQDAEFQTWAAHLDDDVLGFMSAKAAKEETNDEEATDGAKTGKKAPRKKAPGHGGQAPRPAGDHPRDLADALAGGRDLQRRQHWRHPFGGPR